MGITYVGGQVGGRAGSTSTSNVTFALTGGTHSTPQPGDLVVIGCTVASQARTPACAISGYTSATQINANGTTYDTSLNMSWKVMGGTADTTFTLPSTGNIADAQRWTVQVWRGFDTTNNFDVTTVSASGTATGRPNPGSVTPTTTGAVVGIIGAGAAATGAAYTAPANYTTNFLTGTTADTNDAMIGSGYRAWTSGTEDPAAYTGGTTNAVDSWAAFTYVIRPEISFLPTYLSTETIALPLSSTPGAQNITIPANATMIAVHWRVYGANMTSLTSTGAGTFTFIQDGGNEQTGVGYAAISATGAQTITPVWSATPAEGPLFFVTYVKDVVSVRSGGAIANETAGSAATGTIFTRSTDLVLALDSQFDAGAAIPSNPSGWTSRATQGQNNEGGRLRTMNSPNDSHTTVTGTTTTESGIAVIAVVGSASATGYTLTAQGGAYSLAGGTASVLRSKKLIASGGSYNYTGASAVLTWAPLTNNYVLTALGGSYAYTGASVGISRNRKLTSNGGAYIVTGGTAALLRSKRLVTTGGSYVVTGASANVNRNRKLTVTAGSYSLSGSNATINRNRTLTAQGGVYTYTGQQVVITYTAGTTNYTLTALGGAYTLTGGTALLARNRVLVSSGGSYSYTGSSASLLRSKYLSATGGVYSVTGATANIFKSKRLVASGGSYVYTGNTITLKRSKYLNVSGGSYSLVGSSANITWGSVGGAVWPPVHLVLLGTVYGPTGTEYTGTLDVNGIKYDITTGQLVKPINDKVVMSI